MDGGNEGPAEATALLNERIRTLGLPAPGLLVCSGGGVHAYWPLASLVPITTPVQQQRFSGVLRRLVGAVGGEPAGAHACPRATDCARILRLPGTWNLKRRGEPRPVRLVRDGADQPAEAGTAPRPIAWWEANLPALPLPIPPQKAGRSDRRSSDGSSGRSPRLTDRALERMTAPARDGEKHYRLVDVAVLLQKQGQPPEVIRAILLRKAANSGVAVHDPHQQRHLDDILDWVTRTIIPDPAAVSGPR
jgi:hypothetical protein